MVLVKILVLAQVNVEAWMIYLGFDPSTQDTSYAALDLSPHGRRYLEHGECALHDLENLIQRLDPLVVAIERPAGIHIPPPSPPTLEAYSRALMMARASGLALMNASYVAGRIAGAARHLRPVSVEVDPSRWRIAIGARRTTKEASQDQQVKEAIQTLIDGWPRRSNNHARDSAGVALGAYLLGGAR